jgi:hypothetical protein
MGAWATGVVSFTPGFFDASNPGAGTVGTGGETAALGVADSTGVKSLGDTGSIVLELTDLTHDGLGDDFAVFENGFDTLAGCFCELAFVEVSSDGVTFIGFETEALNGMFPGELDPTDYRNFAGKLPAVGVPPIGVGFDLNELASDPLVIDGTVDILAIRYVRLTDIFGDGLTLDSFGDPIFDAGASGGSAGFDIDAVGILNVPEPDFASLISSGLVGLTALGRRRRRLSLR